MKKQFLFCFYAFTLFVVTGCQAQPSQVPSVIEAYPANLSLTRLPDGLNDKFGMKAHERLGTLKGNLCWIGPSSTSGSQPHSNHKNTVYLQIVDVNPAGAYKARNFALPAYDERAVGAISYPSFLESKNDCFVRVLRGDSDVAEYTLYKLNLSNLTGKVEQQSLYLSQSFSVSPNGSLYAFTLDSPHNKGEDYHLIVGEKGNRKIISRELVTEAFSWTLQNTLLYPSFQTQRSDGNELNFGYPDIFENDLKGNTQLLKKIGYRPSMSPDRKYLACYTPYVESEEKNQLFGATSSRKLSSPEKIRKRQIKERTNFDGYSVKRTSLSIYDLNTGEMKTIKRIFESYPALFWSKDGNRLYMVENLFRVRSSTSVCRISVYNTKNGNYKLLSRLEQQGSQTTTFTPIKIANEKHLLLYVPTSASSQNNYRVLAVDLSTGKRHDVFSFSSIFNYRNIPVIDWIEH